MLVLAKKSHRATPPQNWGCQERQFCQGLSQFCDLQLTNLHPAYRFWVAPLWTRLQVGSTPIYGPFYKEPQSLIPWPTIAEWPRSSQTLPIVLNAFSRLFRPSQGALIWPPDEVYGSVTGLIPLGGNAEPISEGLPDDVLTRRLLAGSSWLAHF